jgi:hypothetical protein
MFKTSNSRSKTVTKLKIERTVMLISMCLKEDFCGRTYYATVVEADFSDITGTKILRVFLLAIHYSQSTLLY